MIKASVESDVGQTPVMAVAVSGVRRVVVSVLEKVRPGLGRVKVAEVPPEGSGQAPIGMFTRRSLSVGVGVVAVAPSTCIPSLVAASRSVIAGELSADG